VCARRRTVQHWYQPLTAVCVPRSLGPTRVVYVVHRGRSRVYGARPPSTMRSQQLQQMVVRVCMLTAAAVASTAGHGPATADRPASTVSFCARRLVGTSRQIITITITIYDSRVSASPSLSFSIYFIRLVRDRVGGALHFCGKSISSRPPRSAERKKTLFVVCVKKK